MQTEISRKSVEFGDFTHHKTLIFDLDETLIQSKIICCPVGPGEMKNGEAELEEYQDFAITLEGNLKFGVTIRPHLYETLDKLSELYELAIFTAAE